MLMCREVLRTNYWIELLSHSLYSAKTNQYPSNNLVLYKTEQFKLEDFIGKWETNQGQVYIHITTNWDRFGHLKKNPQLKRKPCTFAAWYSQRAVTILCSAVTRAITVILSAPPRTQYGPISLLCSTYRFILMVSYELLLFWLYVFLCIWINWYNKPLKK